MGTESDSAVAGGKLAEACVLFALAAGGGSALQSESQTEFLRRVGEALDDRMPDRTAIYSKQGTGRRKPGSTHIHAVQRFVEQGLIEVTRETRETSGRPYAINRLSLSDTGWERLRGLSKDSPDILHLMPKCWHVDALSRTPGDSTGVEDPGAAPQEVLGEEILKTLLWIRHEVSRLAAQMERMEERMKNTLRPSGTTLLAEVFSSLATMFNSPPSKT